MTRPELTTAKVVFCDSLAVLRAARESGLNPNAIVRTSAPALALAPELRVQPLEAEGYRMMAYWNDGQRLTTEFYSHWRQAGKTHDEALIAARVGLGMHRRLTRLLALDDSDFRDARLFLGLRSGDPALDERLNAPWPALLADNPRFSAHWIDLPQKPASGSTPPSLIGRLRLSGFADVAFVLAEKFWRKRATGNRPVLLCWHPTELLRETAWELCRRGMVPKLLDFRRAPEPTAKERSDVELGPAIDFVARWFPVAAHAAALKLWRGDLARALGEYDAWLAEWRTRLAVLAPAKGAVLSGFPGRPAALALGRAAAERGLPVATFQHGVTREIAQTHDVTQCNFENSASDLFFVFNGMAKDVTCESPFGRADVDVVGMPRVYKRMTRSLGREKRFPILYVSTAILSGDVNLYSGGVSDIERSRRERVLAAEVLSQLPHGVTYKPYPSSSRYADPDPVQASLAAYPGIRVFDRPVDLRYMVGRYSVLVTARATSTVSWCIMSRKPLVYINHPDHAPLRPEAYEMFSRSLFLFDWDDPAMLEKLRDFLSQPISDIVAQWRAKTAARQAMIAQFITAPIMRPGRAAADAVESIMARKSR